MMVVQWVGLGLIVAAGAALWSLRERARREDEAEERKWELIGDRMIEQINRRGKS